MKLAVSFGKVVVLAAWFWGVLSFIMPTSVPRPEIGRMVFFGLIAVHAAEAFIFAKAVREEAGGSIGGHVGKLFVFGYFHVLGVRYG